MRFSTPACIRALCSRLQNLPGRLFYDMTHLDFRNIAFD